MSLKVYFEKFFKHDTFFALLIDGLKKNRRILNETEDKMET